MLRDILYAEEEWEVDTAAPQSGIGRFGLVSNTLNSQFHRRRNDGLPGPPRDALCAAQLVLLGGRPVRCSLEGFHVT